METNFSVFVDRRGGALYVETKQGTKNNEMCILFNIINPRDNNEEVKKNSQKESK